MRTIAVTVGNMGPATDLYKYSPDAVPPIHAVSYHVATYNPPAQNGDKFRSIFSDNLQPIATRGKKARGTLLVDKHALVSTKLAAAILGGRLFEGGVRPVQYCPCGTSCQFSLQLTLLLA